MVSLSIWIKALLVVLVFFAPIITSAATPTLLTEGGYSVGATGVAALQYNPSGIGAGENEVVMATDIVGFDYAPSVNSVIPQHRDDLFVGVSYGAFALASRITSDTQYHDSTLDALLHKSHMAGFSVPLLTRWLGSNGLRAGVGAQLITAEKATYSLTPDSSLKTASLTGHGLSINAGLSIRIGSALRAAMAIDNIYHQITWDDYQQTSEKVKYGANLTATIPVINMSVAAEADSNGLVQFSAETKFIAEWIKARAGQVRRAGNKLADTAGVTLNIGRTSISLDAISTTPATFDSIVLKAAARF